MRKIDSWLVSLLKYEKCLSVIQDKWLDLVLFVGIFCCLVRIHAMYTITRIYVLDCVARPSTLFTHRDVMRCDLSVFVACLFFHRTFRDY